MVEFRVLGPLDARGPNGKVSLGGGKQQLLLAVLLLHGGELVSRPAIIDALWPERPPASASQSVDSYVSRLRAALRAAGADGELIVSGSGGYRLQVAGCWVDREEFSELARSARVALANGELKNARDLAGHALALWRGTAALAGIGDEHSIRARVAALDEERLQVFETRAEAELELGDYMDVIPELRAAASRDPTRERLQVLLMLALYRAGRQAEALEVYRAVQAHLDAELGLTPGPALREIEARILRHDPRLAAQSPAAQPPAAPAAVPTRAGPWRLVLPAGLATLVIAAATIIVLAGEGGGTPPFSGVLGAPALGTLNAETGGAGAALALRAVASRVTAGLGAEWVTSYDNGTLLRIDPSESAVVQTVQVGHGATGVAVDAGDVWVADTLDNELARVDASTNEVVQKIPVGTSPGDVAAGDGAVWVANQGDGTVSRIDPLTGAVLGVSHVGPSPSGIAVGDGSVWVALSGADTVARLDPRTGQLLQTIHVGSRPSAVAVGRSGVWVANELDSTVSMINPVSDTVALTRAVAGAPTALAAVGPGVWVAADAPWLTMIKPSGQVRTVAIPSAAIALTPARGRLLVAVTGIGANHRGGTLIARLAGPINQIDPAACCVLPPNVRMLSYDSLLSYSKSPASPDALVPDLALAIPAAQDNRLSYTFRLRPGLRYWNGVPVRASDFRRGLELAAQSSGIEASYIGALPGALGCPHEHICDLRAAVIANDAARTVTLRLTHPDPDLLPALGLPYFAPDPAGGGIRPGTGPYRIARYIPGQLIDLKRNPNFRPWAPTSQPAGYPDRILVYSNGTASADIADVLDGRADFTFDQPTASQLAAIQLRSPGLLHTEPLPNSDWLDLNTKAAPFNDVRVRQALNYAVDRNAIVQLYGGPDDATATCQILPATIPGHVPYCPYTRPSSQSNRWTSPDLARARELIAASGTRGDAVTLLTQSQAGPSAAPVGHYIVGLLRTLGYRAHLRVVDQNQWGVTIDDYHHPPQIDTNSWIADVPSPSQWITVQLSCDAWRPPTALANHSHFCDPVLDRLAARAAQLQTTDPTAAERLWARADRDITNLAPWIPTVTANETDLISKRVGNYQYVPTIGALLDQLWVR